MYIPIFLLSIILFWNMRCWLEFMRYWMYDHIRFYVFFEFDNSALFLVYFTLISWFDADMFFYHIYIYIYIFFFTVFNIYMYIISCSYMSSSIDTDMYVVCYFFFHSIFYIPYICHHGSILACVLCFFFFFF